MSCWLIFAYAITGMTSSPGYSRARAAHVHPLATRSLTPSSLGSALARWIAPEAHAARRSTRTVPSTRRRRNRIKRSFRRRFALELVAARLVAMRSRATQHPTPLSSMPLALMDRAGLACQQNSRSCCNNGGENVHDVPWTAHGLSPVSASRLLPAARCTRFARDLVAPGLLVLHPVLCNMRGKGESV